MNYELLKYRLGEVVNDTALDSSKADFLATHMPFNNLKFITGGLKETRSNELSEEEYFKKYIMGARNQHNFIIVRGGTGSGKSHLIRWLYYRYKNEVDPNEEVIAIITRGQNTLKGALQQIIKSEIFVNLEDSVEFKKLIEANNNLSKDELREQIAALLVAECNSEDEEGKKYLKRRIQKLVHSFLSDEIIREYVLFKKDGPIDRIMSKLVVNNDKKKEMEPRFFADDFLIEYGGEILRKMKALEDRSSDRAIRLAEKLADERKGPELRESLAKYLNSKINKVIQASIKIGKNDLIEIFNKARSTLKKHNKSLTLFIEDVTTLTGIDRELIEALKINHKEEKNLNLCRITSVIGITNYYYDSFFPDNIKERITSQIIIEDRSLFVSPNDVCEFIGRYINAVNISHEELEIWLKNGANDKDLPINKDSFEHKWALFKLKDGRVLSLYPFNKNAILNIYNGLERKTPRLIIKTIMLNIYNDFIENPDKFPPAEKNISNIEIPRWKDPLIEDRLSKEVDGIEKERTTTLLKLWGEGHIYRDIVDGNVFIGGIPENIFRHFNLPVINGIERNETVLKLQEESIKNKLGNDANINQSGQVEKTESSISSNHNKSIFNDMEYEKKIQELNDWINGGVLINHKQYREDFCDLIKNFFYWEEENISPLFIKLFVTINNFYIEGQNTNIGSGFVMKRDMESYYVLMAILNWKFKGGKTWDFPNSEEYVLNITNYLNNHKDEIFKVVKHPNIGNLDCWDYEGWTLLNEYYLRALNGELDLDLSLEEIYKIMFTKTLEICDSGNHGNIWNSLLNRIADDEEVNTHHDIMIRYYNMILGGANPEITKTFYLDAYQILNNLERLKHMDWEIDKSNINKIKEVGKTSHFIPLNMMKKYWVNKIDKIIEEEMGKIDNYLERLNQLLGDNYDEKIIDQLNRSAHKFLEETLYDIKENFNDAHFNLIINNKYNGEQIMSFLNEIKSIKEQKNIDKIISLSKSHNLIIEEYINTLNNIENKVKEVNSKFKNRLSRLESDEIIKIEKLSEDIEKTLDEIEEELSYVIEVDSYAIK